LVFHVFLLGILMFKRLTALSRLVVKGLIQYARG
jgi:hypothetical protein